MAPDVRRGADFDIFFLLCPLNIGGGCSLHCTAVFIPRVTYDVKSKQERNMAIINAYLDG